MIVELAGRFPHVDYITKKFGDDYTFSGLLGFGRLGYINLGRDCALDPTFGIYRSRKVNGVVKLQQTVFYRPSQPRTVDQQANRSKFADAVSSWQSLSDSDRDLWRRRAYSRHFSGYNLYLKSYMLSH